MPADKLHLYITNETSMGGAWTNPGYAPLPPNAIQNIRPGGVIVGHDYGDIKDGSQVVDEAAKDITIQVVRGTHLAVGWQGPRPIPAIVK